MDDFMSFKQIQLELIIYIRILHPQKCFLLNILTNTVSKYCEIAKYQEKVKKMHFLNEDISGVRTHMHLDKMVLKMQDT